MIKINGRAYPYKKSITVWELMELKGFDFYNIVVRINGQPINREKWKDTYVVDGDDVLMLHMFAGG